MTSLFPASYSEVGVLLHISLPDMAGLLTIAIAIVALAPALTVRKMQRMYIPGTLRVLE